LSAIFADEVLQDYFYEVPGRFATARRRAYDADSGYLGSKLQLSLRRPLTNRFKLLIGANLHYHGGAANEDSPLFSEDVTAAAGLGLIWSFYQSDRKVSE
jgi:outer membrane scaffolding protein for murein synthesis (MipA/OmpV family)